MPEDKTLTLTQAKFDRILASRLQPLKTRLTQAVELVEVYRAALTEATTRINALELALAEQLGTDVRLTSELDLTGAAAAHLTTSTEDPDHA